MDALTMDSTVLCRRIQKNDTSLKDVVMLHYTAREIENVMQALLVGDKIRIEGLLVSQSPITVKTFVALLSLLCLPKPNPGMNYRSWCPLKKIHYHCGNDDQPIVAEAIVCRLFRGIVIDSPHGSNAIEEIRLAIGTLSERSATAIRDVMQPQVCTMLMRLAICNTRMTESTFRIFCSGASVSPTLVVLDLSGCGIGDSGAEQVADVLRRTSLLHDLLLKSNKIGDAGAVALAKALKKNKTLEQINLDDNRIRDAGFVALAKATSVNTRLRMLCLSENRLSVKGEVAFADSIASMKGLMVLFFGPIHKTATLARVAEAMKVNTSMCHVSCVDERDATIAAMGSIRRQVKEEEHVPIKTPNEKGESKMERVRNLITYIPLISFLCLVNKTHTHDLIGQRDVPMWMWPHIIRKNETSKLSKSEDKRMALTVQQLGGDRTLRLSLLFYLFRQKPNLMNVSSRRRSR